MNIVFDLGGVVFDWKPDDLINRLFSDKTHQLLVKKHVFQHTDWAELDRGTLSLERATKNGVERTGLPENVIRNIFDNVPKALIPIQETITLLESIKNSDNDFYVLSNMQKQCLDHLERSPVDWKMFSGVIFSCEINKVKPEAEIYLHLLEEYSLEPKETIFIDDLEENLVAAKKHDIKTIHFKSAEQCRTELQRFGCV